MHTLDTSETTISAHLDDRVDLRTARAKLRTYLADFFDDVPSAKRIADDAGLSVGHIKFGSNSVNLWHDLLREAEKSNHVGVLLNVLNKEYPDNYGFQRTFDQYKLAVQHEIEQSQPLHYSSTNETAHTITEIKIPGDFGTFSDKDQQKYLDAIRNHLMIPGNEITIRRSPGSIKLSIELPRNKVANLYNLVESGELAEAVANQILEIDLSKVNLRSLDLQGANLSRANLSMADLRGTNLSDANLQGATLDQAIYDHNTQWPENIDPVARGAFLTLNTNIEPEISPEYLDSSSKSDFRDEPTELTNPVFKAEYWLYLILLSIATCVAVGTCLIVTAAVFDNLNIQSVVLWILVGFSVPTSIIIWLIYSNKYLSKEKDVQTVFVLTILSVSILATAYLYILLAS